MGASDGGMRVGREVAEGKGREGKGRARKGKEGKGRRGELLSLSLILEIFLVERP